MYVVALFLGNMLIEPVWNFIIEHFLNKLSCLESKLFPIQNLGVMHFIHQQSTLSEYSQAICCSNFSCVIIKYLY